MAIRSGFEGFVVGAIRAAKKAEAAHRREIAYQERQEKAYSRELARRQKERDKFTKQEYIESRIDEASELTNNSEELFMYLKSGIIRESLNIENTIDFECLKPKYKKPKFNLPKELKDAPTKPDEEDYVNSVGELTLFGKIIPSIKQRWLNKIQEMKSLYQKDFIKWQDDIKNYNHQVEKAKEGFKKEVEEYELSYKSKCDEVDEFRDEYFSNQIDAVVSYVKMVLENSDFLMDWEREYKVAYSSESKELLVEFKLPNFEVIPHVGDYKYVKSKDFIEEKLRKKADLESCYKALICSVAIRTIHEIIDSDKANAILLVGFNGYVNTIDPSNGRTVNPVIISVLVSKSEFESIKLENVDPIKCIKSFSASVSSSPEELVAVKPIRELNMVDKRFVIEEDIASTIDNRPNLMELDPFEFENLVSNLFSKMNLETRQTRTSKDGGVDAIAFDTRPILGGKIVIQAKRYKNVVGVSAARDLYGTMINEGACKGILVTTSHYGADTYEFVKDKPIELIDGGGLLYLLNQVGINAKIIFPE